MIMSPNERSLRDDKDKVIIRHWGHSQIFTQKYRLDPVIIKPDERLFSSTNSMIPRMEGENNIKTKVVHSLEQQFTDDYCFHRPASATMEHF